MTPKLHFACVFLVAASCSFNREPLPLPPSFQALASATEEGPAGSAFLGLTTELNQAEDVFSLEMPPGVRVTAVEEGSPAEIAGVVVGDILLQFAGRATDDPQRLQALLEQITIQQSVVLRLQRGSEVVETDAALIMQDTSRVRHLYHVDRGFLRAAFRDNQEGQPQVVELAGESPLAKGGVRPGDVILSFQGQDPGSSAEFLRRAQLSLQPGDEILLTVVGPRGSRRELALDAFDPGTALTQFGLWPLFLWEREIGNDRGEFRIGRLIITDIFRYSRDGDEREYSVLSLLEWETGELVLEDNLGSNSESQL
ncbi:MAG: PDZ domain-containing protein [Planctomycetota bacterium]|nr:PDZ domain-containing protein [Planctomycetota bacterium]MDA1113782.1 PDZ domain-containing protein [Planctomycetota bacterium]